MSLPEIDLRNPIVHMTLWNLIASGGLVAILLLYASLSVAGRAVLYESTPFLLLGILFWLFISIVWAAISGLWTGAVVWALTFSAIVNERTITRWYISVWSWIGGISLIVYGWIGWWYLTNQQWGFLPLTIEPRPRDVMLCIVWIVVIPLVGATRFVDNLKADPRYTRKRSSA